MKAAEKSYTVVGYYAESGQPYCGHIFAKDAYDAYTRVSEALTVISVFEGVYEDLTCSAGFKRGEKRAAMRRKISSRVRRKGTRSSRN